jgi:D-alanyl-D-alanine carboxypeptidase
VQAVDEVWDVEDLAKFTMILSANDGAYALSEKDPYFIENLNLKIKRY